MKSSATSTPPDPAPPASRSANGSACPGSRAPTRPAGTADAATRTSANTRPSPVGTSTAATPTAAWWPRASPTRCRTPCPTSRPPRCCAPASSATGPSAPPTCRPAAPGHLWLRRQRAPHRTGRPAPGHARARPHPRHPQPDWQRPRRRLGRRGGRRTAGTAGRRDPVRPGRRPRPGRPARPRPRRHPRGRRHLALRHPTPATTTPNCSTNARLRSVTANTRRDGEEFLRLAQRFDIRGTTHAYPMAHAQRALQDLAHGRFGGAAVLHN